MKRTPDSIEQCLNQLEVIGNDELMLFMDLDPTYYTIRHLLEVRETWVEQVHLFQRSNSVKNLLGVFAIRSKFNSHAHLDNIGQLINMELEKRGVKIPHYDY